MGDMGNVEAKAIGVGVVYDWDTRLTLNGPNHILGRSVNVHVGEDDLGRGGHVLSKKTGNAGGRIGCGVIGRVE